MEISIKEQQENAVKWLEALLSGNYKQSKYVLGDSLNGYCCWGLGCNIVGKVYNSDDGWDKELYKYIGYRSSKGIVNPIITDFRVAETLDALNDELGWSFEQIAGYLIQNASTNFIPEVAEHIKQHFKPQP